MDLAELMRAVKKARAIAVAVTPHEARQMRERAGVSRERAGAAIGVSARTIHRWETGATPSELPGREYRKLLAVLRQIAGQA